MKRLSILVHDRRSKKDLKISEHVSYEESKQDRAC